ncbi:hypothetical protein HMPREF1978_01878 [Actinomyces graevenitzii F0530]|uniref:Uncharacterized protein n=1 Tax=Actinomyces graevenitzii F0530 TaxID=1321817 RepID=U1PVN5_9ACTO|nr:hypothetical protein HMPREF1978_01878 [Actinomyces graevenitzii F0530]
MSPRLRALTRPISRFPRSRGDEPGITELLEKNGLFSPLTRG